MTAVSPSIPNLQTVSARVAAGLRPYRIAAIEPLQLTQPEARRHAAEGAGLNVSCLDPLFVDVDLRTDSATASATTGQLAATAWVNRGPDDPAAQAALVQEIASLTGKRYVVLFAQGRAAEAALADALPMTESVAAANGLFPSTRFHLERRGCRVVECSVKGPRQLWSEEPFGANLDLEQVRRVLSVVDGTRYVWLELACNSAFGQPVSLSSLESLADLARALGARICVDATRCTENAVLLRRREPSARDLSIREIVRRTLRAAHAVSASCLKSFHVQAGGFVATDDGELAQVLEDAAVARGDGLAGTPREVLRLGITLATSDAFAEDRARQAGLLHRVLREAGVPVFSPEAAHAVFLDASAFLPHLRPEEAPAKALALALYLQSGIRVDEHFPSTLQAAARL